jgi:hypothetical protein
MKFKPTVKVYPGEEQIYVCTLPDVYDVCMLFCRAQEFYESPFMHIRGKRFDMFTFMKTYSKAFGGGSFTYAGDWAGFNLPSRVIDDLYSKPILDINIYDTTLRKVHKDILQKLKKKGLPPVYYLIGCKRGDAETIEHEYCHAKFALDPVYRKKALKFVRNIPIDIRRKIEKYLTSIGYSRKTMIDELQAYVSCDYYYLIENIKFTKKQEKQLWKMHCVGIL